MACFDGSSQLLIAPAALRGICVWHARERGTTVSLRVYEHSALAWASVVAHHKEHARRFGKRELAAGPDLGADSFRKPMGETFDVTCAVLGDDIACLSASARHTEDWVRNDQKLLSIVRDRLKER
jgi:hypothetical protein